MSEQFGETWTDGRYRISLVSLERGPRYWARDADGWERNGLDPNGYGSMREAIEAVQRAKVK